MYKEIGSEFWDIPTLQFNNNIFPETTQWFASGRSALKAIIEESKIQSIMLPDYCCESIITPCKGIEVFFYPSFEPISTISADAILIMDYFGYIRDSNVQSHDRIVIRDLTHSFFHTYNDANYYFGSLRKWAGFWTGGFAYGLNADYKTTGSEEYIKLRRRAMEEKQEYIKGTREEKNYLDDFAKAEELLEEICIAPADPRDILLAKKIDVEKIMRKRRNAAEILLDTVKDSALFPELLKDDCPMFVPIVTKKRDDLRQYLIDHGIYCPIHWPMSRYHRSISSKVMNIYNNELSLVCDQRYDEQDMERIVDVIKSWVRR